jgi:glycosyltransferase involved in cell wall biosynthesis
MAMNYMLFSAPNIPSEIEFECTHCGASWKSPDTENTSTQKCKNEICNELEAPVIIKGPMLLPGLYSWINAFREAGGKAMMEAILDRDTLENFDLIHVNITPGHPSYAQSIRRTLGPNSDTKIIANVDYAMSMWGNIDPYLLENELLAADLVFHVESQGAARISRILNKPVPTIPHPVDVDRIKKFRSQPYSIPTITCQYHRYWGNWAAYHYALRDVKDVRSILCNLPQKDMPPLVSVEAYFSQVCQVLDHPRYLNEVLSKAYINIDVTPDATFGRGIVEAAALGIPTIGTASIEAMKLLFPDLIVMNPDDDLAIKKKVNELLDDTEHALHTSKFAEERCKHYDNVSSYKRMVYYLEEVNLV